MRTVSFLIKTSFFIFFCSAFLMCSDPLFWVTSREETISKNNLPKDAQATGIIYFNNYYYTSIGVSLWRRPVNKKEWLKIETLAKNILGISNDKQHIYLGSESGILVSSDGVKYTKLNNLKNATLAYSNKLEDIPKSFFVSLGKLLGQYDVYTLNGQNMVLKYRINSSFTGFGSLGVSSNNAIFNDHSLNGKVIFDWISGYSNNYLYADGFIGMHNGKNWVKKAKSEYPANQGASVFEYLYDDIKALYGVYGTGYFELYEENNILKSRVPQKTVKNKESYEVSDLAFATITNFYKAPNEDLFALSNKGLWRNSNGVWIQE